MHKYRVGILGATGMVGQRMIQLLEDHPLFTITALAASDQSAGKTYNEAATWRMDTPCPTIIADMIVSRCTPDLDCDFVLSGLSNKVAGEIEVSFAAVGYPVISNAKNHRMEDDVPLLIPEVNADHVAVIQKQQLNHGWRKGFIVTNPNCSTVGLVCALKPLHDAFGVRKVMVTTMQAVSGAGYPGVASFNMIDNIVPFISGEEEKIQTESLKILGKYDGEKFISADIAISAHCNRVPVVDGHTECVSVTLDTQDVSEEDIIAAWRNYSPHFISYREEEDRPQPRRDRMTRKGMGITVGRLRKCTVLGWKFVLLSHNTIRGAAGAAIADAELLAERKML